jgi:hypothetical protein
VNTYNKIDRRASLRRRSGEILCYIAINALIIVAVFAMFAAGMSWEFFSKWGGLAFSTAFFFGHFVSYSRRLWKKRKFWSFLAAFLCVHLVAWAVVLTHARTWKVIWFWPMLGEVVVLIFLRDWVLFGLRRNRRV